MRLVFKANHPLVNFFHHTKEISKLSVTNTLSGSINLTDGLSAKIRSAVGQGPSNDFNIVRFLYFQMQPYARPAEGYHRDIPQDRPHLTRLISFGEGVRGDSLNDEGSETTVVWDRAGRELDVSNMTGPREKPAVWAKSERWPVTSQPLDCDISNGEECGLDLYNRGNIATNPNVPCPRECMYKGCGRNAMLVWSDFCHTHTQNAMSMVRQHLSQETSAPAEDITGKGTALINNGNVAIYNDPSACQHSHPRQSTVVAPITPSSRPRTIWTSTSKELTAHKAFCTGSSIVVETPNLDFGKKVNLVRESNSPNELQPVSSSTRCKQHINPSLKKKNLKPAYRREELPSVYSSSLPESEVEALILTPDLLRDYECMVGNIIEASKYAYRKCIKIGCLNFGNQNAGWFCNQCVQKYSSRQRYEPSFHVCNDRRSYGSTKYQSPAETLE